MLLLFRQKLGELIHRAIPPLFHSFMRAVKRFTLFVSRIERCPFEAEFGFAVLLGERGSGQHLQRPCGAHRMSRDAAVYVGEGIHKNDFLRRFDLAINELALHLLAVRRLQTIMKNTSGSQIEFCGRHLETFRPEPLQQLFAVGPGFPDSVTRCVECARDDKGFDWIAHGFVVDGM